MQRYRKMDLIYSRGADNCTMKRQTCVIAQADLTFENMQQSINAGVLCIHLEQV